MPWAPGGDRARGQQGACGSSSLSDRIFQGIGIGSLLYGQVRVMCDAVTQVDAVSEPRTYLLCTEFQISEFTVGLLLIALQSQQRATRHAHRNRDFVWGTDVLFTRAAQMPTTSAFTVFRGLCSRKRRACRVFRGVVEARMWRHRMHRYLRCFLDFAAENVVPAVVFAEHPWAKHDNVQIRLHPFPHSIHGPTMITSRSDHIHCRRASMCQP